MLWLCLLAGCRTAPVDVIAHNDFERLEGWLDPLPQWLTTAKAHSGRYATVVTPTMTYGPEYHATWEQMGSPRRVRVRAWVWLPHERTKVVLVLQAARGEDGLFWELLRVNDVVRRRGQWELVQRDFTLPDDLQATDYFKLFVWQRGASGENIYFDDISLEKLK